MSHCADLSIRAYGEKTACNESFASDRFLKENGKTNWNSDQKLHGFEWGVSAEPITTGILVWDEILEVKSEKISCDSRWRTIIRLTEVYVLPPLHRTALI